MLESDVAADPIVQFRAWWEEARATGDAWSEAMVLATSSPAGGPSARAVILRGVDERGFVFFTDTRSAKAVELEADPRVALVVLWSSLERQVRVVGHAAPVTDEEADAFFAARPRAANLAAQVARQDEVIAGPDVLQRRLHELAAVHDGRPVGRPPGWGGYVVAPDAVELWQGQPDHLHDRLRYRRDGAGWRIERLAP
ncbi:MAG: pyridoxamine 5'-phosphate oxidase [Nocardioidaceae bacterium]